MPVLGPFPVEFGTVFPSGAYAAGGFDMIRDWDRSSGDRIIQQADKATGLPLWVIEVINPDPETRQRTVKVKIAAPVQPVLPSPAPGSPFTPVEFDGMTTTPWVDSSRCSGDGKHKCAARLAYSLKATGVRAPSRGLGRPAPKQHRAAVPTCLEDTHRLRLWLAAERLQGGSDLEAIRRRGAAPAGVRVDIARTAPVIVEGVVGSVESRRPGIGAARIGTPSCRHRHDGEHDGESTKTHKPSSPTSESHCPCGAQARQF